MSDYFLDSFLLCCTGFWHFTHTQRTWTFWTHGSEPDKPTQMKWNHLLHLLQAMLSWAMSRTSSSHWRLHIPHGYNTGTICGVIIFRGVKDTGSPEQDGNRGEIAAVEQDGCTGDTGAAVRTASDSCTAWDSSDWLSISNFSILQMVSIISSNVLLTYMSRTAFSWVCMMASATICCRQNMHALEMRAIRYWSFLRTRSTETLSCDAWVYVTKSQKLRPVQYIWHWTWA